MKRVLIALLTLSASDQMAIASLVHQTVAPTRIVWQSDTAGRQVRNSARLLEPYCGQVSVASRGLTTLRSDSTHTASILLDFGRELQGGLKISSGIRPSQKPLRVRVCLGESVSEAMSSVDAPGNPLNATNEHSLRDAEIYVPWLGSNYFGDSGFRFARIDLLDKDTDWTVANISAILEITDEPEIGRFECNDTLVNRIWDTGAYTVKLNMQDYLWDGIKRDRLVWLGDMHPEVMTINTVFGNPAVVRRSLDFAVADTPLPGWMNGMCAYSLWWIIIQRDLYMHSGDKAYLAAQVPYMTALVEQIDSHVDADGVEHLTGTRFVDWPTSENDSVIHTGLQALTVMALDAALDVAQATGSPELARVAADCRRRAAGVHLPSHGNSQAAALNILSGLSTNPGDDCRVILHNGVDAFSTFYGFYMLSALAKCGYQAEAMELMKTYWGAMIALGATTFWEDLKYADTLNASPITEAVPEGKYDIHAGGGAYCYKGLRLSLCHGWASGPTPWLTANVLGVKILEPGCRKLAVKPALGNLDFARGIYPTPFGPVEIEARRNPDGSVKTAVRAPKEVKIVR